VCDTVSADEPSAVSRRAVLSGTTTTAFVPLAGCFSLGSGSTPELRVFNFTAEAVTVDVKIRYVDGGELVVDDRFTLADGADTDYPDPYPRDGEVELEVVVDDDRYQSFTFQVSDEQTGSSRTIAIEADEIQNQVGAA
jgi:hypothetical protein